MGYALLAGLSFINELRVSDKTENKSEASKKVGKGVVAFFDEQVRLPGVCVSANGVGFLMTMGLGVYNLDPLITFASVIFATAEFASASICNSDVARQPREKLSIEKQGRAIWENVPSQVRTYLKTPGALFPIGNAIIYGRALVESVGSLGTATPLQTTFMVCGGALMTLAGVVGLKPLIAKTSGASRDTSTSAAVKRNPSIAPIVASALANGMIGDVMISAGLESGSMLSVLTGAASLFWCAGNLRMALKLSKLRPKADDAWARFVVDKVIVRIEERLNDFNQAQTKGESRSGILAPSDEQQKNKYDFLQKLIEEHKTYKPSQSNRHPQSELHRIIKGFIVNFISQSESDLQPLNIQHGRNPEALEYWNSLDPKALENARLPGMFHAAASYNHLKREHPGRGESSRKFHAIGEVLRVSIDIFKEEHAKLNLSEKTRASIYNRYGSK